MNVTPGDTSGIMVGIKRNVGDTVKVRWMNEVTTATVVQVCAPTVKWDVADYRVSINNVIGCPRYQHNELITE